VATWSAAAWIVMQQFGVTGPSPAARETRIVWIESASRSLADREMLPDGRVITIPIEIKKNPDERNRDPMQMWCEPRSLN